MLEQSRGSLCVIPIKSVATDGLLMVKPRKGQKLDVKLHALSRERRLQERPINGFASADALA